MSDSEWKKVDFQEFIDNFGKDIIVENAPTILYSKKDKEHEAFNSLIAFFFITGALLIYISISYFLSTVFFNLFLLIAVIVISVIIDLYLFINYIKTNVYIKLLECWIEVYRGKSNNNSDYYCFSYYPIFSGKCHPNIVKNIVYKIFQEEVLKSKIDITQIEFYFKLSNQNHNISEKIGFFFQYGEGRPFKEESVDRNSWKFFSFEDVKDQNLAIANWDHQFEWQDDLKYDFDKLHQYAPWIIKRWNSLNIKPLTEDYKVKIDWDKKNIESIPKIYPWLGNLEEIGYENPQANRNFDIIEEAIEQIIGKEKKVKKLKDLKEDLLEFKTYFRDLTF